MDNRMSINDFINAHQIIMTVKRITSNPLMDDMPRHFMCTLKRGDSIMKTRFSQGSAHTENPSLADVLDCLGSDSAGYENAKDFEDWASEYGYDTDSRKAEKIYNTVAKQAEELKAFLGEEAYNQLLWETEKL